jgi:hypothetical protein
MMNAPQVIGKNSMSAIIKRNPWQELAYFVIEMAI